MYYLRINDEYLLLREYFKDNEESDEPSLNSDISEWFVEHHMRPTFILNVNRENISQAEGSFEEVFGEYIRETNMREAREVDLISMKNSLLDESWGDPIIGFSSKEEALLFKLSWM